MSSKLTEKRLEYAIIKLLEAEGYEHALGQNIDRNPNEVLIEEDTRAYLLNKYAADNITPNEIDSIIHQLETFSSADLYKSNRAIMQMISDGFLLKREDHGQQDLYIQLVDFSDITKQQTSKSTKNKTITAKGSPGYNTDQNIYKIVSQLEIVGFEKRIPDGIIYINGLPLVIFEFKSAIREEATIHDAYIQLTTRYRRDIPELFKYNAICVISDGINNKAGSLFAPYEYYYAWRKTDGSDTVENDGIYSLYTMIQGMFNLHRLRNIIRNFIYFPDTSNNDEKIICRYPQYYAATKLIENIKLHCKPVGDGKGGTYFGATGCGKSFTMLFLTRLLMNSVSLSSPTIVLITDRIDLDDQLSELFTNAKNYIGDAAIISIESRQHLRQLLKDRNSGGVFLTTIHKFTESTELLTDRSNVICISDEAHRSQINLDQKVQVTEGGVRRTFGFAKYLHDSLPNATYVGFTGTPIDATLDVFGEVTDAYTMTESVKDEITVRIIYEGRAAKVLLDNSKLQEIEDYYAQCAESGTSEYQIETSKKATVKMNTILGDPNRIKALAGDFVKHYENRISEGSTIKGKAMFISSSRQIAYDFYKELILLRPNWAEVKICEEDAGLTESERKNIKPMERVKMIMTRGKDDSKELYDILGNKDYRKEMDRQFKNSKSNFKIAIVVDMWLTGFDVPFLDTIYIDKPIQRHNLIQAISRVNRKFAGKEKGLVVDYIGIKQQMNQALAKYSKTDRSNFEEIKQSVDITKNHLNQLEKLFYQFDKTLYFSGSTLQQYECLNMAAEFIQVTQEIEKNFMYLIKRLKAAYDICSASGAFSQTERDYVHFYLAVRSIVFKLTKGNAPDAMQMNARVRTMIKEALNSGGVEEILIIGETQKRGVDIFDDDYLAKIEKIKLPNTKIKLLQQLLGRAIDDYKIVNKTKGTDFTKKFKKLVDKYNERKEQDTRVDTVLEDFTDEVINLIHSLKKETETLSELGIDIEEKAFYDILKALAAKYNFEYPEDRFLVLSKEVKKIVDNKSGFTDWNKRENIKAELKVDLTLLLEKYKYPPVDRDEIYKEIFEQAENFKKYQMTQ